MTAPTDEERRGMAVIPYFDPRPEYRRLKDEIDAAVARVLDSGRLILGPEVAAFETEFASWVGSPAGVGAASGTDALILALRALGVRPGDEVLTVANAGVPPVAAVRAVGARPRFADVDPASLLIDPAALEPALTPATRVVMPVHLYGRPVDVQPILEFASAHGLPVVEDCAQGHGARLSGRHVGTFGAIGCFSFYPTKNLGACGDGGLCVTADPELEQRLRRLRVYGLEPDGRARVEGLNSRLDELQAAILRVKLRHLDRAMAERRRLARLYLDHLDGSSLLLPEEPRGVDHAFHLFVIRGANRASLTERLDAAGIGYGLHYPEPVHLMEGYAPPGSGPGSLPVTEQACRSVLSLPLYHGMKASTIERVARVLRDAP
jgi:dTDP-4-amino-4,6-dideoxygalactose transaminase